MSNITEYGNIIAFHPGSYLQEIIEDMNTTQSDFAKLADIPDAVVNRLISGEQDVDESIADKLSKVTGISKQSWLNIQKNYSDKIAKIKNASKNNK